MEERREEMAQEGKGGSPGYEGSQSSKTRNGNYSLISQVESHRLVTRALPRS